MSEFGDLSHSGFYREALEEYVEARLYEGFLSSKKILKNDDGWGDMETYIGGLSDATGEVVRWAVARATDRDVKAVKDALAFVNDAVEFFLSLDLTGYLRTKSDQAKKNLRSLEQILYELSLRL
jgi:predicted translin family RNA/ssDNA-binding protein